MSLFFGRDYILKSISATGNYDKSGVYVAGTETESTITANVQPITGKELESLNVGRDNLGKTKIYTDEILNVASPGTDGYSLQNGDKIVFNSDDYEIIQKLKNEGRLINHYKYIAELRA